MKQLDLFVVRLLDRPSVLAHGAVAEFATQGLDVGHANFDVTSQG